MAIKLMKPTAFARFAVLWLTASMLLAAGRLPAQDSLRNSLAGDAAAEAPRQQLASEPYTYKAGDFRLLVVPSLEMDYNDNVNLSKTDAQSDFILKPLLQLTGQLPVDATNLLSFAVGLGYNDDLTSTARAAHVS